MFEITSFETFLPEHITFDDETVQALALPTKRPGWHPLNIPVHLLDQSYDYRWKAYAVSERDLQELQDPKYERYQNLSLGELEYIKAPSIVLAMSQIQNNLNESISKGWKPMLALHYPELLVPEIRKFSNGLYIRYNGLMLMRKPLLPEPYNQATPCVLRISSIGSIKESGSIGIKSTS